MLMLYPLPINIIPFLLLGVSIFLFGLRGVYLYKTQKTPLILYYGIGAILGGVSALMYSVPFFFSQDEYALKLTTIVGDLFYFASILVMARLIWYLGLNKKISFAWVLVPYLLFIIGAFVSTIVAFPDIHYSFSDNSVHYPVPVVASWFFAAMSSAYVFVGILTLKHAKSIAIHKQRTRLILIGLSFLLGGTFAIYNFLFLHGSNTSVISAVGYILSAIVLFIGIFIISRKKR